MKHNTQCCCLIHCPVGSVQRLHHVTWPRSSFKCWWANKFRIIILFFFNSKLRMGLVSIWVKLKFNPCFTPAYQQLPYTKSQIVCAVVAVHVARTTHRGRRLIMVPGYWALVLLNFRYFRYFELFRDLSVYKKATQWNNIWIMTNWWL